MAELNTVPASGSPQEGAESTWEGLWPKFRPFVYYCRRNPQLVIGACLLISLGLFVVLGYMFHDVDKYRPLSAPTKLSPRAGFLFGNIPYDQLAGLLDHGGSHSVSLLVSCAVREIRVRSVAAIPDV